ncbi:MAG: hypothetical protein H0U60_08560 [Blastocatellia bacterium]|nr:hypothetical protein [Blastocatellia bacterium]
MRRSFIVILMLVMTVFLAAPAASAQFIKIPKIPKPKPQPTPTETTQPAPASDSEPGQPQPAPRSTSTGAAPRSGGPYAAKPEPPATPQFLPDTLEIQVEHWDYYWKIPNDNHNTSWAPRIRFDVFYGGSSKLRYKADYFMPDGSLWYSEALEYRGGFDEKSGISLVQSESDSNRDKKAVVTGGVFGIKITNIRDNSTVFQGKFKVVRYKPTISDARYKNEVDYYVDYDWKLPIGFADLYFERDYATPIIRMWFKGDIKGDNLEARLFHNGQQIATTDDGGSVNSGERYYADKRGNDESLFWNEFKFSWPNRVEFIVTEDLRNFTAYKNTLFLNQMPGDYVVKVYYNGEQVRETRFSIGSNGTYADNGIARQNNLTTNKIILPVRVMGTLDKWNAVNAKAMGFYGNPVNGLTP